MCSVADSIFYESIYSKQSVKSLLIILQDQVIDNNIKKCNMYYKDYTVDCYMNNTYTVRYQVILILFLLIHVVVPSYFPSSRDIWASMDGWP